MTVIPMKFILRVLIKSQLVYCEDAHKEESRKTIKGLWICFRSDLQNRIYMRIERLKLSNKFRTDDPRPDADQLGMIFSANPKRNFCSVNNASGHSPNSIRILEEYKRADFK